MKQIIVGLFFITISSILTGCSLERNSAADAGLPAQAGDSATGQQPTVATSQITPPMITPKPAAELLKLEPNQKKLSATIETSMGDITVQLLQDKSPMAVANFVGLAEGTQPWVDPKTGYEVHDKPLYENVIFHRVIKGFMIQAGDPLGTGTGGPGYRFKDEVNPKDSFSTEGILAMANAGPNTNGSQFFITEVPTPHLNGGYTIFGKVISGMDIVHKIANVQTGAQDRPLQEVVIKKIVITRS